MDPGRQHQGEGRKKHREWGREKPGQKDIEGCREEEKGKVRNRDSIETPTSGETETEGRGDQGYRETESTCSEAGEKRKWGEGDFEKRDTASKIITNLSPKDMKAQAV